MKPLLSPTAAVLLLLLAQSPLARSKPLETKEVKSAVSSKDFIKYNCTTSDGHRLLPGQDHVEHAQRNCTIFQCTKQGMQTLVSECVAPRCVLPTRKTGACCLTCPKGFNCRLPTGKEMKHTEIYENDNTRCECPKIRHGLGWEQDLVNAECYPITTTRAPPTTPPPNCPLHEGEELKFGEIRVEPAQADKNGCIRYECGLSGRMDVQYGDCAEPKCKKPERQDGACCLTCPGDRNATNPDPVTFRTTPTPPHNGSHGNDTVVVVSVDTFFKMLLYSFFGIPFELVKHSKPHNVTTHEIKTKGSSAGKFQHHHQHHHHGGGGGHHHHHHQHHGYGGKNHVGGGGYGGYQQRSWWQG